MITEQERGFQMRDFYREEKERLMHNIKIAERYERLSVIQDFQDLLEEWRNSLKISVDEVSALMDQMVLELSPFKRLKILNSIIEKKVLMNQLDSIVRQPQMSAVNAAKWREELDKIREEEKRYVGNQR